METPGLLQSENQTPHTGSCSVFESEATEEHSTKLSVRMWSRLIPKGLTGIHQMSWWLQTELPWFYCTIKVYGGWGWEGKPALHLKVYMNLICNAGSKILNIMHFLNKLYSQNQMKSMHKPPSTNSVQTKCLWKALYDKFNSRTKFT